MEERLNLLRQAGVIDGDICSGMLQVVNVLDERWQIPVYGDQGVMAVTHMANALMRSRRGEIINPLDDEILNELKQSSCWPDVEAAHRALLQLFTVSLHPHEEGYLLANLYSLWMAANDRS